MKTNSILLQNLSPEELGNLIDDKLKHQIEDLIIRLSNLKSNDELLTREETCNFLSIDSSTLWAWTNKGKVKAYGIGNRRYYKRSELLESLKLLKK